MSSPTSVILASIVTVLVSFEAILKRFYCKNQFKIQFQALKCIKIATKLTSIVTILANIALAIDHIFQVLGRYS